MSVVNTMGRCGHAAAPYPSTITVAPIHKRLCWQDTDWAVFFYKPYCPACRRVWPVFRALGNSLNSTVSSAFGLDPSAMAGVALATCLLPTPSSAPSQDA